MNLRPVMTIHGGALFFHNGVDKSYIYGKVMDTK